MRSSTRFCLIALTMALSLGMAATAAAETKLYDWADQKRPVLIENDSGLIFITEEKEPDRVYAWSNQNAGDDFNPVYLVDLGVENGFEIVGAGDPMFVLQTNGDPLWSLDDGCRQTIIAHFMGRKSDLEVLCQSGTGVQLYTNDGQKVWSIGLGAAIDQCRAGDYNGDLKTDLECKYRHRDQWVRIDADGEILEQALSEPELSEDAPSLDEAQPASTAVDSEQNFDLDGDGNADERLKSEESILVIDSRAKEEPIARVELDGEPEAALVKDLDGDGEQEIIAVTGDSIFVISHDGEDVGKFSASASDYKRVPHASLRSVYANGFEDDQKAKEVVEGLQDNLSKCYAGRVGRNKFTNTGRMILQVKVDENGGVSGINRTHSDIRDSQIQQCAERALRGGDYPAAAEGTGTINVKMKYTFRDE